MYLLVATYAGHNFDECDLHATSHVLGAYKILKECEEAVLNDLKEFFSESADNYCDDSDSVHRAEEFIKERMDSVVFNGLDDSNFTRPYAERDMAEYSHEENYGLDVIKYLVIKI